MKTIFLLLFIPLISRADGSLTLEAAVRDYWSKNPQLEAQESQASLASGDRFRRFLPNEPVLQYNNSDDNTARSYGLQLTVPFPLKTIAMTRLDAAKARSQDAEYHGKKYDLAKLVMQGYMDCASAQEAYTLQKVTSEDLETVFQSLKALYEGGHSTQAEKISAELQSRQARLDLVSAKDKQEVMCKKFHALIGSQENTTTLQLPDDLNASLVSELGELTADQYRATASVDTAQANSSIAWWSEFPDFTLSASRNHYIYQPGSPSGKVWTNTYGVSVTLPVLFLFSERVEAQKAKNQAAIDEDTAVQQKIVADSDRIDGAAEYARSLSRLKELRRKDLPLAEALMDSTYSSYRAGKLGFAELVLARKMLTDLRSQDIALRTSIIGSHLRCLTQCATPVEKEIKDSML